MTIWLKRVGGTKGRYDLPHQAQDAIRMIIWVDNPLNLFQRTNGHLLLPTEPEQWAPTLSLETEHPGPLLPILLETNQHHYRRVWGVGQRPYSYRVDLPSGVAGDCFKIIEASYPLHKHTVCLPPAASDPTCARLAPPDAFSAAAPALYSAIGPIRHPQSTRDWAGFYDQVAARVVNHVTYHVAMGASGLLLYADDLMRRHFARSGELVHLVQKGQLRLVEWELQERAHNDTDGVGRPLGYNYDQGLTASHALLGLSACGANLLLLNTDLDEYLYFPPHQTASSSSSSSTSNDSSTSSTAADGAKWPAPWTACLAPGSSHLSDPAAVHRLYRFETLTTAVRASEEPALWVRTGTLEARVDESGGGDGGRRRRRRRRGGAQLTTNPPGANPHPLALYDAVIAKPLAVNQVKQASLPAAWVVLFWVHEGAPLHGRTAMVGPRCAAILHIANAFRERRRGAQQVPLPEQVRRFRHWMFVAEGSANESLWQL